MNCPRCDGFIVPTLDTTTWPLYCVNCGWEGYDTMNLAGPAAPSERKRRGRPPLSPEEKARRLRGYEDLPPEEVSRRAAISASMRRLHEKKGHRMSPQPLTTRNRMKVNNGYVEVQETPDGIVMTSTEIDSSIPTGSRTCTVIMKPEHLAGLFTQLANTRPAQA